MVGVVGNAKRRSIEGEMHPEAYYAATQWSGGTKLVIRTTVAPGAFIETLRRIIRELDPDMAVHDVRSMDYFVEQAITPKRLPAILLTAFGAIALFLAAIGVYGLISYLVTQRTQEIGVRIALGARRVDVVKAVIRTGLSLAAPGICLGLLAAVGLTRIMGSLLYGVRDRPRSVRGRCHAAARHLPSRLVCAGPQSGAPRPNDRSALRVARESPSPG